jgi:hypothetical protein
VVAAVVTLVAVLSTLAVTVGRGVSRTWTAVWMAPRRRRAAPPTPMGEEAGQEPLAGTEADDDSEIVPLSPAVVPAVVFLDPHRVMHAWTEPMMEAGQVEILAYAVTADEAIEAVRRVKGRRNVTVLVDLGLAGSHDLPWLIRNLRETLPHDRILVAGPLEPQEVSWALFIGADSFVATGVSWERAADALRRTAVGEIVVQAISE